MFQAQSVKLPLADPEDFRGFSLKSLDILPSFTLLFGLCGILRTLLRVKDSANRDWFKYFFNL